jgi:hypothetical protein
LNDLFAERVSKSDDRKSKSEDEAQSAGGPSLLSDVFTPEAKRKSRIPLWAVVTVLVVLLAGALTIHRLVTGPVKSSLERAVEAMAEPVSQAEPPPSLQPDSETGTDPTLTLPAAIAAASINLGTNAEPPPVQTSPASRETPETRVPAQAVTQPRPDTPQRPRPTSSPGSVQIRDEDKPKLVRGPEEPPDVLEQKAFEMLRDKSVTARALLLGSLESWRMLEWQATSTGAGEYLINIIAEVQSTGQRANFVWAVDPEKQTVRAMSQGARDLEARRPRP